MAPLTPCTNVTQVYWSTFYDYSASESAFEPDHSLCWTFLVQRNADGFSWSSKEICHQTVLTTPCVCCLGKFVQRSNPAVLQPQKQLIWPLCLEEWIPRALFIMTVLWLLCQICKCGLVLCVNCHFVNCANHHFVWTEPSESVVFQWEDWNVDFITNARKRKKIQTSICIKHLFWCLSWSTVTRFNK